MTTKAAARRSTKAAEKAEKKAESTENTRARLAQPFGMRKPTEEESKVSETEALRGTLPDVLDPAAPDVKTMDRQAAAGKGGTSMKVDEGK